MKHIDPAMTDRERWPLMTVEGRMLLSRLQEHPRAPRFNHCCGDRLTAPMLERVRAYEREIQSASWWTPGVPPDWVGDLLARCRRDVPFYRTRPETSFAQFPSCDRGDLNREAWAFVPPSEPLEDLIVYDTSGTTGQPVTIPSHPIVSSLFLPLLRMALARRGVSLEGGAGRVSILLVCAQQSTWTFPSISSYLDGAAYVKINLNPADWRDPADREAFIDDLDAEIWSGDPLSFLELMTLPLARRPKALVSTALELAPAFAQELETHFDCPVIDLYSMNECRALAAAGDGGHALIAPDVYIEILGEDGRPASPGVRGEVAITSGRNPCLPLIRYLTGDRARLVVTDGPPILADFEGRAPVVFLDAVGDLVNNIDVALALRTLPLAEFSLRQDTDRSLGLRYRGRVAADVLYARLEEVFGALPVSLHDETSAPPPAGKRVSFASAFGQAWKTRPRRAWGRAGGGRR